MKRVTKEDLKDWGIETPVHAKMILAGSWYTEDPITEMAEVFTPLYNTEILADWQDLPPSYQNRALEEGLVELDPDQGAIQWSVMMADLHLWYEDEIRALLESLAKEEG